MKANETEEKTYRFTGFVSGEFDAAYRRVPQGRMLEHTTIWKHRHKDDYDLVTIVFKVYKRKKK